MTLALKIKESKAIAALDTIVSAIRNGKGKGKDDFIIQILNIDKEQFDEISTLIDTRPDMDDWDIATAIYYK